MKTFAFFALLIIIFSCSGSDSVVSKQLAGSDSLVITFNVPNSDSIVNMVSTTEKKAIRKLSGFLNGKESKQYKCGFDGSMIFYKQEQELLAVVFKYSDADCRNFMFEIENKLTSRKMNNEATNFLKSLVEGKGWY